MANALTGIAGSAADGKVAVALMVIFVVAPFGLWLIARIRGQ